MENLTIQELKDKLSNISMSSKKEVKIIYAASCFASAFIGYCIGRLGSMGFGYMNVPHHWIYGLILMSVRIFYKKFWGTMIFFFGLGMVISDLTDLLQFNIWSPDLHEQHFWGID